ncbi:general secretion pathway protein GspB [Marinobacter goseongensis]|jgi:general secretion pathway protein B|uniref:general secretion pathway protein GspB n=1 Tax=Marinobacter goseongensis TaxID=453838 RepID=UPI002003CC8C|nr:general secretion pathway protein GspB [Marinobacter goseongensis]MCK7550043.1 general secretion pathway protein GspB [Marinobacter goseongensis]
MSYILDALRKSESERRQGKVPDLGQQVQIIHKPRKKSVPPAVWITIALIINAVVLAFIFWPVMAEKIRTSAAPEIRDVPETQETTETQEMSAVNLPDVPPVGEPELAETGEPEPRLAPTIIVPDRRLPVASPAESEQIPEGRVPHLVELPVPFQRSIPDLKFNSHIYASEPSARRVMINNQYMRVGDSFSGIRVERITEEGVELSKEGRRFRVGVVRDWMSPR